MEEEVVDRADAGGGGGAVEEESTPDRYCEYEVHEEDDFGDEEEAQSPEERPDGHLASATCEALALTWPRIVRTYQADHER